jgi:hypothetical protein
MRAFLLAVLLVLASLATAVPTAGADHLQASGSMSLSFDHKGGNEWWVEVRLGGASAASVKAVEAMDTGGAWKPLTLRSWGNWAASFQIEPDHLVTFRATFTDGAQMTSCAFTHPAGAEQCGTTPPPPPPPGGFDATFSGVKGNAWWVETKVGANKALAGVDARVNGGDWKPLQPKSWGAWAASFSIPEGSLVQLRARATDGGVDFSAGGWRWTAATPHPAASSAFAADFQNVKGNAFYAQVNVYADRDLKGVDVRVDEGVWQPLARRAWGDWSLERAIPDGSVVRFRAVALDGAAIESGGWRWPSITPVDGASSSQWPREGSYLVYAVDAGSGSPGGDWWEDFEGNVTLRHLSGRWEAECVGKATLYSEHEGPEPVTTVTPYRIKAALEPPMAPTDVTAGQQIDFPTLDPLCAPDWETSVVTSQGNFATRKNGVATQAPSWNLDWDHGCNCMGTSANWSLRDGLLLRWGFGGRASHAFGILLDTDAPIAHGDLAPTPPPAPAWPREGSVVRYQSDGQWTFDGIDVYLEMHVNVTLRYAEGAWTARCVGKWQEWRPEGYSETPVDATYEMRPLLGPLRVRAGDAVMAEGLYECNAHATYTEIRGQFSESTTRNGAGYTAKVWWSDEPDGDPDADAWWNLGTGLTLRWEFTEEYGRVTGKLRDTDAPLV